MIPDTKSAVEVLEELKEARQHKEDLTITVDGAEVHMIVESLLENLESNVLWFLDTKGTNPDKWESDFGTQSEVLETSREIGLTILSVAKNFIGALPQGLNLAKVDANLFPTIEKILTEN